MRDLGRWHGIALLAVALVATLWLAATGQLVLYIHPRYVIFTVVMAAVGLALVVASFSRRRDHSHEHEDELPPRRRSRLGVLASVTGAVLTLGAALSLIVLPPTTLSAATAVQRDVTNTTVAADAQSVEDASSSPDSAFAAFTVRDWSSLLRQTSDVAFYEGKPVDMVGFITEDPEDPDDMFHLTRFVVTCCAVDAQPIGIPVYAEDWRSRFAVDQWVELKGGFGPNASRDSSQPIALEPDEIVIVDQPAEPYLF